MKKLTIWKERKYKIILGIIILTLGIVISVSICQQRGAFEDAPMMEDGTPMFTEEGIEFKGKDK